MLLLAQQLRDVAVRVVDIAKVQRIGNAGIDAGRRRQRFEPRRQAVGKAEVDAVRAERAFLRHAEARGVFALDLVLHRRAVGEMRAVDEESGLVRTGDLAIGAANTEIVVDGDDAVGALACRRGRTDRHAGRIGAMLAADRHESAGHVRK